MVDVKRMTDVAEHAVVGAMVEAAGEQPIVASGLSTASLERATPPPPRVADAVAIVMLCFCHSSGAASQVELQLIPQPRLAQLQFMEPLDQLLHKRTARHGWIV